MNAHLSWETVNDLVDDRLTSAELAEAEAHARQCASCGAEIANLRDTLVTARELPDAEAPPDDLWADVCGTIEARKVAPLEAGAFGGTGSWWMTPRRLAAAAVVLVTLSSGITAAVLRDPTSPTVAAVDQIASPTIAWQVAEQGYLVSVLELRSQLAVQAGQLAPGTIAAIERSLATIDVAIAEAREALLRDPSNATLPELLASNYRQKIDLLRRAAQLASST